MCDRKWSHKGGGEVASVFLQEVSYYVYHASKAINAACCSKALRTQSLSR